MQGLKVVEKVLWPLIALLYLTSWVNKVTGSSTARLRAVCEAVDTVADAGQPVWFQDYHLALAPDWSGSDGQMRR